MGSGKGTLEFWVAVVKPGRVMFEIAGVPEEAREALRLAMHKPCVNVKLFLKRTWKAVCQMKTNKYVEDLKANQLQS